MGSNQLLIRKAGLYTSIQDLGRKGLMNKGVARSGAMDVQSALLANWLVGNSPDDALLEITYQGLHVQFECSTAIAISGGDLGAKLNDQSVRRNQTIIVRPGDELRFEQRKSGFRAYLAIAMGIPQQAIMGSRSTHSMIDLGIEKIKDGTALKLKPPGKHVVKRSVPQELRPVFAQHFTARILPGPEFALFPKAYIDQLTNQSWGISADSNRMGYRLKGDIGSGQLPEGILSSGIIPGTIQVTSSGQPIILMNDGPTTGGYARLGNIITPDLYYIAQLGPGDSLRFAWISFDDADRILKNYSSLLNELIGEGLN